MNILGMINSSIGGNGLGNMLDVALWGSLKWLSLLVTSGDSDGKGHVPRSWLGQDLTTTISYVVFNDLLNKRKVNKIH